MPIARSTSGSGGGGSRANLRQASKRAADGAYAAYWNDALQANGLKNSPVKFKGFRENYNNAMDQAKMAHDRYVDAIKSTRSSAEDNKNINPAFSKKSVQKKFGMK